MLQAVAKAVALMLNRIVLRLQIDEDISIANLNWKTVDVIRPEIERSAAGKVEARMVPMAAQNAVFDRTAVKREAHMRAAVIQGINLVSVQKEHDCLAIRLDRDAALAF